MNFSSLGLIPPLISVVKELGYVEPTYVQVHAIPAVLAAKDVCALARTGSGKTAAFLLPLLQRLAEKPAGAPRKLRALVLAPTRELAAQTCDAAKRYSALLPERLKIKLLIGGVSPNPQMQALRGGADLVVATPGRLLDLVGQNALTLKAVQSLVLDEADQLLAQGFAEELARIFALLPTKRQNLLFSATMPAGVKRLAETLLNNPQHIEVKEDAATPTRPAAISQRSLSVDEAKRTPLLRHLLATHDWDRVLVFVASRHSADHVCTKLLRAGIPAAALHGDLSQTARTEALADFKSAKVRVLIATDVASRGLDIVQLPAVINYDLPRSPTDYVHRIGRTGRAGATGTALSFVTPQNAAHFRLIEKRQGVRVPRETIAGFEPDPNAPAVPAGDPNGGIKGRRKSKKDKLREAAKRGGG